MAPAQSTGGMVHSMPAKTLFEASQQLNQEDVRNNGDDRRPPKVRNDLLRNEDKIPERRVMSDAKAQSQTLHTSARIGSLKDAWYRNGSCNNLCTMSMEPTECLGPNDSTLRRTMDWDEDIAVMCQSARDVIKGCSSKISFITVMRMGHGCQEILNNLLSGEKNTRVMVLNGSATILTTHLEEGANVTSSASRILAGHAALMPDKPSKAARVQVIKDKAEAFIVVARTSTSVSKTRPCMAVSSDRGCVSDMECPFSHSRRM